VLDESREILLRASSEQCNDQQLCRRQGQRLHPYALGHVLRHERGRRRTPPADRWRLDRHD
jgi:hypothetical protein